MRVPFLRFFQNSPNVDVDATIQCTNRTSIKHIWIIFENGKCHCSQNDIAIVRLCDIVRSGVHLVTMAGGKRAASVRYDSLN